MVDRVWIVRLNRDGSASSIHSVHASEQSAKDCLKGIAECSTAFRLTADGDELFYEQYRFCISVWELHGDKEEEEPTETPAHYKGGLVFQVIDTYDLGFYFGNVIKYVCRHKQKGGLDDLRKAKDYLDREIRKMEGMKE